MAPSRTTRREFLHESRDGAKTDLALTAWTNRRRNVRRNVRRYLGAKRLTDPTSLDVKRWHRANDVHSSGQNRSTAGSSTAAPVVVDGC